MPQHFYFLRRRALLYYIAHDPFLLIICIALETQWVHFGTIALYKYPLRLPKVAPRFITSFSPLIYYFQCFACQYRKRLRIFRAKDVIFSAREGKTMQAEQTEEILLLSLCNPFRKTRMTILTSEH